MANKILNDNELIEIFNRFDLKFFITDKATICGVKVERDGGYILFENKLINLDDFNHFLNEK